MAFSGWPVEAIEFFEGLEADNSKPFWQANKDVYERAVKGPMEELLAELAPALGEPRLFRPYRDVRFSRDKAPYKTNIAAVLGGFGYVELSSRGLGAGGGRVHLAPDQLQRYRAAAADEEKGGALEAVVAAIEAQGHECGPHEALRTAPRGYPEDHPRIALLRQGPHRLAPLAACRLAWHAKGQGPDRRGHPRRRALEPLADRSRG